MLWSICFAGCHSSNFIRTLILLLLISRTPILRLPLVHLGYLNNVTGHFIWFAIYSIYFVRTYSNRQRISETSQKRSSEISQKPSQKRSSKSVQKRSSDTNQEQNSVPVWQPVKNIHRIFNFCRFSAFPLKFFIIKSTL